jgi:transcriptional regulator with XRE-family HTH domain
MLSQARRPIERHEDLRLLALGEHLRVARVAGGLTQREAAEAAQMSIRHLKRLEQGTRRTRATTLARLAQVLDIEQQKLLQIVGGALAPESPYADRIARRRERRHRP